MSYDGGIFTPGVSVLVLFTRVPPLQLTDYTPLSPVGIQRDLPSHFPDETRFTVSA